jgi:hypothetical protein
MWCLSMRKRTRVVETTRDCGNQLNASFYHVRAAPRERQATTTEKRRSHESNHECAPKFCWNATDSPSNLLAQRSGAQNLMMDSLFAPQCSTTVAYVSDTVDDGKQAQAIELLCCELIRVMSDFSLAGVACWYTSGTSYS